MSSFRRVSDGVDLDSIFAARITAPGPITGFRNNDGVDLNQRYEAYNGVGIASPTGYRGPDGRDLSLYFTTVASMPVSKNFDISSFNESTAPGQTATSDISFLPNGNVQLTATPGSTTMDTWAIGAYSNIGDLYEIQFVSRTGGAGGTWGGVALNTWLSLSTFKNQFLRRTNVGNSSGSVQAQIRRVGTATVAAIYNISFYCDVGAV